MEVDELFKGEELVKDDNIDDNCRFTGVAGTKEARDGLCFMGVAGGTNLLETVLSEGDGGKLICERMLTQKKIIMLI